MDTAHHKNVMVSIERSQPLVILNIVAICSSEERTGDRAGLHRTIVFFKFCVRHSTNYPLINKFRVAIIIVGIKLFGED